MRRFILCLWCTLLCALAFGALALGDPKQPAANAAATVTVAAPNAPCVYTSTNFNLTGIAIVEDTRPFTTTAGETFLQFVPAPPITTTAASSGYLQINGGWSGSIEGDILGTFAAHYLNGLAITASTLSPEGRGFQVNEITIRGATGTITALLAVNFVSTSAASPFYPRTITAYIHSTATSGSYAPYKFAGTLNGTLGQPNGGSAPLTATVQGRLYSGGGPYNLIANGTRILPTRSALSFQPGDILAQFVRPDFSVNASIGRIEPLAVFTGQIFLSIAGTITLDHQSLLQNNGTINDFGWLAGNFRITTPNGDTLEGPWLSDLPDVSFRSYIFLNHGTGAYADSLVFSQYQGAISYNGGTDIAGGGYGSYCDGMQPVGGTPTPVETLTATNTPTITITPTVSPCDPASDYVVIATTGAAIVPGVTDIGNHCIDCVTNLTLPFPVRLYDSIFTSVNVSSHGNLQFGSSSIAYNNTCLPYSGFSYSIMPYWDDIRTDIWGVCINGCGIFTSVSGSAPNRVFNIEWHAVHFMELGNQANFEIRLYESSNRFDIIYGNIGQSGAGATIGVQKGDGIQYTQYSCNMVNVQPGLQLSFRQYGCTELTFTPTNTLTPTSTRTATITRTPSITPGGPTLTRTLAPTVTPTSHAAPPNLHGSISWLPPIACQSYALRLSTIFGGLAEGPSQPPATPVCNVGNSSMLLQNSNGERMHFAVPPLTCKNRIYNVDCVVGSCVQSSWLNALPYTLTVDYLNQVYEGIGEGDNASVLLATPPLTTPCPTFTPTTTPITSHTSTYTFTATPFLTWTPTRYPTPRPTLGCSAEVTNATTNCVLPSTYHDTFTFWTECNWGGGTDGRYTVYFEVASSPGGPWTILDQQVTDPAYYPAGVSTVSHVFTQTNIPQQYSLYRMRLHGYYFRNYMQYYVKLIGQTETEATLICPPRITYTPTSTLTPTPTPTPCPLTFTDVQPDNYFYEGVQYLYCRGAITGYADNTFRPYNHTTRAQLCKIVVLAEGWTLHTPPNPTFSDVPPDNPFYAFVETAHQHGIISGYADGTFRPGNDVTRGQMCKIVMLARGWTDECPTSGHFPDVPPSHPFYCFIEIFYAHAIITGYADGSFLPGNPATRGQICKIVYQAITPP